MPIPLQGSSGQNPISPIDQSSTPLVNASGVKENKSPTFSKLLLFQNNKLSLTSNQKTSSKRSVGNAQIDAKRFGNQVANNLRLHGFEKDEAKMIGALVEHLQLENISTESKEKTDKTVNVEAATSDNTLNLLGKSHSKIGFAVRRFCNWIKRKKPDSENCLSGFEDLRNAIINDDQGKKALENFCSKMQQNPGFDKHVSAFTRLFKGTLLNPNNNKIFNKLPMEIQKAFIEQNKGDIEFLSTFSNVYKEELEYNSFDNKPMPELLTAFKDAIVSNRDQIIKNPTILASADKATLASIVEPIIKGDEELGKALIQSFLIIDKNYLQNLTLMFNNEFTPKTKDIFLSVLQNENVNQNEEVITGNQLFKDIKRGHTFEFTCPSGKKVVINNNNNKTSQGNFLSKREIFDEIKKQINSPAFMAGRTDKEVEKDLNSLADFIVNCGGQDLTKNQIPNTQTCIHWEGDGCPFYKAHHDGKGLTIEVHTQGSKDKNDIIFGSIVGYVKLETKATVTFYYENSIEACKCKASNIEVNHFEQEIGDMTFLT